MPSKKRGYGASGSHRQTPGVDIRTGNYPGEGTGNLVVSGYNNGVPYGMNVTAPGFRDRVMQHGPPRLGTMVRG
jgi:hypothetical protein